MSWQVRVVRDWSFGAVNIYIYQDDNVTAKMLRMSPDGERLLEDFGPSSDTKPTLSLDHRSAKDVLGGLAAELAQLGFGTPDSGPIIKAKDAHIASLEKELERVERIAVRAIK